jgi:hypothetical protein
MGVLRQALNIIFQVQRKTSNEKLARRKITFIFQLTNLQNACSFFLFFVFSLFGPLLLSNLITFKFLIHLKTIRSDIGTSPEVLQIIFEL